MSVFSLDTATTGAQPVSVQDVWPDAAGYSDMAQVPGGPVMILFEGGGGTYDCEPNYPLIRLRSLPRKMPT